ncbi:hypothetical protein IFM89_005324 [Coptis chinensis]|uniref:Pentatricopeptide repeat-containing protein n=1 Tax=Coptis chinensis TaxID=261450 RepID=A0A835LHK6_9MAGN|nr:hypothetical protein IFM89_005324 [Coptis chinensis]
MLLSHSIFPIFFKTTFNYSFKYSRLKSSSTSTDDLSGPCFEAQEPPPVSAQDFAFLLKGNKTPPNSKQAILISNAIITSNTTSHNDARFTHETDKFLRHFRGSLNQSLVIEVLKLVGNSRMAVTFFIWAAAQIGYTHTERTYEALLEILESNGDNTRLPDSFLQEIRNDDTQVLAKLLNVLIQKCCRNGLWNAALEELGRLKDFGYKPSRSTYNALVLVFLKADRLDSAYLIHREMSTSGFSMDGHTLGCFAQSLCKAGRWTEALKIVEEEEFVPDTVIFTKMISGLCEASLFEEAMEFLHRMRSNSCIPNVVTYRTLLAGCLRKGQLGRCKRILSMMIAEGCYPTPFLFKSLLHAYCSTGDYAYGYKLLKKMTSCGCKPGYVIYNILVGSICGNEKLLSSDILEIAEKAYGEMFDAGLALNKVNIGNFVRCLCEGRKYDKAFTVIREMISKGFIPDTRKTDEAYKLLVMMEEKGCHPNVVTYTAMIDGFGKVGNVKMSLMLLEQMGAKGCTPNFVTYRVLIDQCCAAGLLNEAHKLLEEMKQTYWPRYVAGYCKVIDGFSKDFINSLGLLDEISEGGASPIVPAYRILIDSFCKAGNLNVALELHKEILTCLGGSAISRDMYYSMIKSLSLACEVEKAFELYGDMVKQGYVPELSVFFDLIGALIKTNKWDEALGLADSICHMEIYWHPGEKS